MKSGIDSSGNNFSVWFEHLHRPSFPLLNKNLHTDVCIIGAGITGLTTAYRLSKEGKKVVVLEDGRICSGETGRTSAHLTNVLDDRYFEIERVHGEEGAKFAADSHKAAINYIEEIIQTEKIDCDFKRVNGYLFPHHKDTIETLEKELAATKRAGLTNVNLLPHEPENTFKMKACLIFPDQAQFHPLKYLSQLANIISNQGGEIFELTHATEIKKEKTLVVHTREGFTITANQVVVATNVPINDRVIIHTKQEPNRTYMVGILVPKETLSDGLFWDTGNPYHYIRVVKGDYQKGNQVCDRLIIGGEDHRVGKPPHTYADCFKKLESFAHTHFPNLLSIDLRWSGQIIEPVDYLAFIGHNPFDNENVYIATGDSGNGLTHGTLAAILLSDLILEKENPWTALYDPKRKSMKRAGQFTLDSIEMAASYLSYLTGSDIKERQKMHPDSGAIIRRGLKKIAVYRDEKGNFHECSAVCPHLKSIVHWNSTEKTWDCPAHGSRFTAKGQVINGPANSNLTCFKKIAEEK